MEKILTGKRGQGLVEYALILILVAAVVIVVLAIFGTSVTKVLQQAADALDTSPKSGPEKDCYGSLLLPYLVGLTMLLSLLFRLLPQRARAIAA